MHSFTEKFWGKQQLKCVKAAKTMILAFTHFLFVRKFIKSTRSNLAAVRSVVTPTRKFMKEQANKNLVAHKVYSGIISVYTYKVRKVHLMCRDLDHNMMKNTFIEIFAG